MGLCELALASKSQGLFMGHTKDNQKFEHPNNQVFELVNM